MRPFHLGLRAPTPTELTRGPQAVDDNSPPFHFDGLVRRRDRFLGVVTAGEAGWVRVDLDSSPDPRDAAPESFASIVTLPTPAKQIRVVDNFGCVQGTLLTHATASLVVVEVIAGHEPDRDRGWGAGTEHYRVTAHPASGAEPWTTRPSEVSRTYRAIRPDLGEVPSGWVQL